MKIAIISKIEHAQPHAEALRKRGHEVDVIDPRAGYPLTYDVYVCRIESVSHQAYWDAHELQRKGYTWVFENSKTKILRAIEALEPKTPAQETTEMFEGMTLTKKMSKAIDTFGLFSPSQSPFLTDHQIEELNRVGLCANAREGTALRDNLSTVPKGSWAGVWGQAKADPSFHMYTLFKLGHTGNRMPVQFLSRSRHDSRKIETAARIMGMLTEGQAAGYKAGQQSNQPLLQELHEQVAEAPNVPVVEEELPPEPEVKVETPVVEVAPQPVTEAAVLNPTEPAVIAAPPKPAGAKADLKELLAMLNDAMLSLNIADLKVIPSKDGPKVELSQVVIRKVTSLDDLE